MKGHCWFCESEQEYDGRAESTITVSYGHGPHPYVDITVKCILTREGEVIYFLCEKCRKDILGMTAKTIAGMVKS